MIPEHNVISSLYTVKSRIECYLDEAGAAQGSGGNGKFKDAEQVLKWTHQEMERVLAMTKKIQEAFKFSSDMKNKCSYIPIRTALHESVEFLKKNVSLNEPDKTIDYLEYVPEEFPLLACDGEELKEIFYHILQNAYQALIRKKEGPRKIIVRSYALFGGHGQSQEAGEIEIIDTADGISKEALPFIFEPFYSTKPWGDGNGLGLWLAKRLVQKNEGQISVKTFEGCGTVFSLVFNCAK